MVAPLFPDHALSQTQSLAHRAGTCIEGPTGGGFGQRRAQENRRSLPLIPEVPINPRGVHAHAPHRTTFPTAPNDSSSVARTSRSGTSEKKSAPIAVIAPIGESLEEWASAGDPSLLVQIVQIAGMSWACESTACTPIVETSKPHSEISETVRIHLDADREPGASIRAGFACRLTGERARSDSDTTATVRIRSGPKRESGALIRATVAAAPCHRHEPLDATVRPPARDTLSPGKELALQGERITTATLRLQRTGVAQTAQTARTSRTSMKCASETTAPGASGTAQTRGNLQPASQWRAVPFGRRRRAGARLRPMAAFDRRRHRPRPAPRGRGRIPFIRSAVSP